MSFSPRQAPAVRSMANASVRSVWSRVTRASSTPLTPSMTPSTLVGNAWQSVISDAPRKTATSILAVPRKSTEPLVRAPKRYWPARPPAPWHIGMPPNPADTRFIRPTETATRRGVAGRSGKRSSESAQTATTEFKVVSGICGSAAFGNACTKSSQPGGSHRGSDTLRRSKPTTAGSSHTASTRPAPKSTSAAGTFREESSASAATPATPAVA